MKAAEVCKSCYWANPTSYEHIALAKMRRLDLVWQGAETSEYEQLKKAASASKTPLPEFVKRSIAARTKKSPKG